VRRAMLLSIENASVHYQKVAALKGVSLKVDERSIVTIIGANGAGKSTMLRAISGLVWLSEGAIRFEGARIVFPELTVYENLMTGAFLRRDRGIKADLEEVFEHFPQLKERRAQWAKTLSGGEQQMLAIGRALMGRPRLLLLDEPSMGLAPLLVREIGRMIAAINRERGVPVVLVEQNAALALELARYAYVLETGAVALEGPAAQLRTNDHVRRAYLGG
jgi:branched-chain amino acid transport system ATP-binding protein